MIEKLTPEQEKRMYELRDEVIAHVFKWEFHEEETKAFIAYCYEVSSLPVPPMIVVDSPLKAQLIGNILAPVDDYPDLKSLESKSVDELKAMIGTAEQKYISFCWRDFSDWGWVAFYRFFTEIGELKHDKFNKYYELIKKSGVFIWIAFDKAAIIVRSPTKVNLEPQIPGRNVRRLHCTSEPAISFRDGIDYYFVEGKLFKKDLWMRFFGGPKAKGSEVLAIENTEQRTAVIDSYGMEYMLDSLAATVVATERQWSAQHQKYIECQLLEFKYSGRSKIALKMIDHTKLETHIHLIGDNTIKTVTAALAWKYHLTEDQYKALKLKYES